jgi:hypothetical protein
MKCVKKRSGWGQKSGKRLLLFRTVGNLCGKDGRRQNKKKINAEFNLSWTRMRNKVRNDKQRIVGKE